MDGYICNERSYRDLKRLEKILEDAKSLQQQSLKEKFTTNNRTKRCVPSDSRISPSVSAPSKSPRHAMDQGRTFCFDVIISATIFARRKSAGGNMIGLNQQRKSHASSRSFGGWVRAHFREQRLVIESNFLLARRLEMAIVWRRNAYKRRVPTKRLHLKEDSSDERSSEESSEESLFKCEVSKDWSVNWYNCYGSCLWLILCN